jgi:nitroimidazol reductase NimA-like FMN-containing flavoprotein (pyridoxamine 5'-phosphate oxidase superfamily)
MKRSHALRVYGAESEVLSVRIDELNRRECIAFLARMRVGRLACEQDGQPYVTPFYFACYQDALYGFSTVGQKVAWMRSNPLVCIEADEVTNPRQWTSVVAFCRYEELLDQPHYEAERKLAHRLLSERPIWWEPGFARTVIGGSERPLDLVYFRVHVGQVTGHRASP